MSDYDESPAPPPQLSLNVPQLVAFLLISALAVRWLFFSSSSSPSSTASGNTTPSSSSSSSTTMPQSRGRRIDERHVEQVQAIFPQYGRREILWDLMRNGGSVQATTERILGGRGLDNPPPTFQPPPAPGQASFPSTSASSGTTSTSTIAGAVNKPRHPNLITRYGLTSKIANRDTDTTRNGEVKESGSSPEEGSEKVKGKQRAGMMEGWSQNKETRQAILKRRREEMILEARRRLLEKKE